MANTLAEVRKRWEGVLIPILTLTRDDSGYKTVCVILRYPNTEIFQLNRYFKCGEEWMASVDKHGMSLVVEDFFNLLESNFSDLYPVEEEVLSEA